MRKLKITSLRIDEDTIDGYGKLSYNMRYWSRSSIMAGVLRYVLTHHSREEIMKMVRQY